MEEKWHPVEKSSRRDSPSLRLKCQFQSVEILPLRDYEDFLYFLKDEYKAVCKLFEPNISVKVKEELSFSLMSVFHAEEIAEDVLAEIVVDEISAVENEHLTFRGNSIATKAMEAYIKLVGQRYLHSTLHSVLTEIILSEVDLEIDPVKVRDPEALNQHRANLRTVVKQVWSRIAKSYSYFPIQLQRCFYKIKQYLEHIGRPDMGDNLISSCIFLRYLCPAILSPSLFNMTDEYPSERANRNLTLVAKTLQTLANFTRYEGKENSMEFLNAFLEEERAPMKSFLRQISSPLAEDGWIPNLSAPLEKTDLGRHLSCLHTVLSENVSKMPTDNPKMARLRELLDEINAILHRPSLPELEQISQPTMATLRHQLDHHHHHQFGGSASALTQVVAAAPKEKTSTSSSSSSSAFSWASWTLPKKNKGSANVTAVGSVSGAAAATNSSHNFSHPAPHHEIAARHYIAKPEPGISLSSDTSSSTSLTPSPGAPVKAGLGGRYGPGKTTVALPRSSASSSSSSAIVIHHKNSCGRPGHHFHSSLSLNDTDSSDDSTYSSQHYGSDANSTPRCGASQTLPRPLTGGGTGYAAYSRHAKVQRGGHVGRLGAGSAGGGGNGQNNKSLSDYESEILELRSAMESLQMKLVEAEEKLQSRSRTSRTASGEAEDGVKEILSRLTREEDQLRRDQTNLRGDTSDKERMIVMQQRKIAALDEANGRLVSELNRIGELQQQQQQQGGGSSSSEVVVVGGCASPAAAPKTVDELLDSLHSTPI